MKTVITLVCLLSAFCCGLNAFHSNGCRCQRKQKPIHGTVIDQGLIALTSDGFFVIHNHTIFFTKWISYLDDKNARMFEYKSFTLTEIKKNFPNSYEKIHSLWINYIATL